MSTTPRIILSSVLAVLSVSCGQSVTPPVVNVEVAKLAVTQPGIAVGSALERSVAMTGGQVVSGDGRLTIDVPSGALTGSQMITVQEISSSSPGAIGVSYRLGPEGTTFAQPVKLTFKFKKAELTGTEAKALRIAYQDKEGRWNSIKSFTLDEAASTISIETKHFSDWSLYAGWKLTPQSALARPNTFTALQVKVCSAKDPGSDELAALVYTCAPDPDFFTIQEWAVNGAKGGSMATGTVAAAQTEGTAQFLAPGQAPPANPVSVSASVVEKSGRKTLLNSTIWIDAHPPLTGTIASLQTSLSNPQDFYTTSARVNFIWNVDNDQYEASGGTFFARHDTNNPGGANCAIHTSLEGTIAIMDGTIIVQDNTYFPYGRSSGMFTGTTTCNGKNAPEPISVMDSAVWWPAPNMSAMTPKTDGSLDEQLTGVQAYGAKVNVVWSLMPQAPQ